MVPLFLFFLSGLSYVASIPLLTVAVRRQACAEDGGMAHHNEGLRAAVARLGEPLVVLALLVQNGVEPRQLVCGVRLVFLLLKGGRGVIERRKKGEVQV